jgi:hypothetical protein
MSRSVSKVEDSVHRHERASKRLTSLQAMHPATARRDTAPPPDVTRDKVGEMKRAWLAILRPVAPFDVTTQGICATGDLDTRERQLPHQRGGLPLKAQGPLDLSRAVPCGFENTFPAFFVFQVRSHSDNHSLQGLDGLDAIRAGRQRETTHDIDGLRPHAARDEQQEQGQEEENTRHSALLAHRLRGMLHRVQRVPQRTEPQRVSGAVRSRHAQRPRRYQTSPCIRTHASPRGSAVRQRGRISGVAWTTSRRGAAPRRPRRVARRPVRGPSSPP